jgi:hypothetical protein
VRLTGWGAHIASYPTPYLTAAAAIGMGERDIELFTKRLDSALTDFKAQRAKALAAGAHSLPAALSDVKSAAPAPAPADGTVYSSASGAPPAATGAAAPTMGPAVPAPAPATITAAAAGAAPAPAPAIVPKK